MDAEPGRQAARYIRIFSERNSGSNWHKQLFQLNFGPDLFNAPSPRRERKNKALLRELRRDREAFEAAKDEMVDPGDPTYLPFKHSALVPDRLFAYPFYRETRFVLLVKNPYWVVRSMHKRPYNKMMEELRHVDLDTFARSPWALTQRDNIAGTSLPSVAHLWTVKTRSYVEMAEADPQRCLFIRYEDTVASPEGTLDKVSEKFGLPRGPFVPIDTHVKTGMKSDFKRYLTFDYHDTFSDETLAYLNEGLDEELMDRFGYPMAKVGGAR